MNNSSDQKLIHVIGTDAGGVKNLSIELQTLILSSKRIAASERLLKTFPDEEFLYNILGISFVERKKFGQKKARKKFQFSKR